MKKIMFNEHYGLETATLNGSKTRTSKCLKLINIYTSEEVIVDEYKMIDGFLFLRVGKIWYVVSSKNQPKYKVGEIVAVAQRYKDIFQNADFEMIDGKFITESAGWNNKMFVRSEYMPHQIQITNIKFERLKDISDNDCIREGISVSSQGYYFCKGIEFKKGVRKGICKCFETPREAFASLIDKMSGKGTWDKNPWAIVYYYKLIK